jgi:hypothetical protein
VPRLDFDPTFANNFATRQDLNLGVDKVFNFDGDFNRVPFSSTSSSATVLVVRFRSWGAAALSGSVPSVLCVLLQPIRVIRHFRAMER